MANAFLSKEFLILKSAHESAEALLIAFDKLRQLRGGKGSPTDKEQDILRAMLVLVSGGLDSLLKHLIRRSLPLLARTNDEVKTIVEKFVERKLKIEDEIDTTKLTNKFLARVLFADSQQNQIIQEFISDITAGSLQSQEELFRAISSLGLSYDSLGVPVKRIKEIFEQRNKIIHEFDIIFDVPGRNRTSRNRKCMIEYTNDILQIGENIIIQVGSTLRAYPIGGVKI